jgi:hypothetical protein
MTIYSVMADYEVDSKHGCDRIRFPIVADPNVGEQQAQMSESLMAWDRKVEPWKPTPLIYCQSHNEPIESEFFPFGNSLVSTVKVKDILQVSSFEWLPIPVVEDCPAYLLKGKSSLLYVMRFATVIKPHSSSKLKYFPGTKAISEVVDLCLSRSDLEGVFGFRLEGDPIELYVTDLFVEKYTALKWKGLEFTEVPCRLK